MSRDVSTMNELDCLRELMGQVIARGGILPIPPVDPYDPDAAAFFAAAGITDATQKSAVNQFVLDLKGFSLWTPMLALYPFVGGAATPHSYNLKNPADFQISWGGTVTHNANGITGDGSTGYGDTGFVLGDEFPNTESFAIGVYSRTNADEVTVDIGSDGGNTVWLFLKTGGDIYSDMCYDGATGRVQVANASSAGFFSGSRTASNAQAAYRNGTSLGTGTGAGGVFPSTSIMVLACQNLGGDHFNSSRNLALAFISSGMDATQNANFYTAVQAFQTALGRQV